LPGRRTHRRKRRSTIPLLDVAPPITWTFIAFAVLKTIADPDLWRHVKLGLDILRHRTLPTTDSYSFTDSEVIGELLVGSLRPADWLILSFDTALWNHHT
jgi:hypothetical protein